MKKILLDTLKSSRASLRNSTNYARSPRGFVLIPLILVCFALCQQVQSATDTPKQSPADTPEQVLSAPDTPHPGPLPISNTADGLSALASLTTGIYNSAFGIYSLLSLTDGNFCTGVGAGTLLVNTAGENTATGAGALLSNTIGDQNTADGAFALFYNTEGIRNTAIGARALFNNTEDSNTAIGLRRSAPIPLVLSTWPSVVARYLITPEAAATQPSGLVRSARRPVMVTRSWAVLPGLVSPLALT